MAITVKSVISYLRLFLDSVLDFIFSLYWERKREPVPDLEKRHAFLAESATTLAKKIRNKELKAEELMRAVIHRIKQVNPILNAMAEDRFIEALDEAREVDQLIEAGLSDEEFHNKPFLGVPFTAKECQEMKGMKSTMGLWAWRRRVAEEDSEAVRLLRQAGAIPVATSNLPELLIWQESRNPVYGMTNNPHHTGRSPGGSSGGEAALAASYASTISLCSDVGGSTRMPAFFCGMFGYHPTPGTINTRGLCFRKGGEESMASLGFISKHAGAGHVFFPCANFRAVNLATPPPPPSPPPPLPPPSPPSRKHVASLLGPLIKVIAGDKAGLLKLNRDINIKDINFYFTESSDDVLVSPVDADLKAVMKRAVSKISEEVKTSDKTPKAYYHEGFNHMYRLWAYMMSKEPDANTMYAKWYNNSEEKANGLLELVKKLLGMTNHCFFTVMRLLELQILPKPDEQWAENLCQSLKEDLCTKLSDNGVLLFPSAPHAAPYHYEPVVRPFNFSYWGVLNAVKCPAVQVPLGLNSQGLPIGIQVVAAPYNDALCLTVARYLEKEFGGAVLPCNIKAE